MKNHEQENKPSFKVVDRRGLLEEDEGGCCGGHDHGHHHHAEAEASSHDEQARPPMSFSLFVQTLAHQTMMGLGLVPWPDSGLVKIELELAKETIDILQILKEKTTGNLTSEEQLMVDSLVFQLQMAFTEIAKKPQV